jgi:hypothetical protein
MFSIGSGTMGRRDHMVSRITVTALLVGVLLSGNLLLAVAKEDPASGERPGIGRAAAIHKYRQVPVVLAGSYWGKTCTTDEGYGRRVPCGAGP